ncbi:hypothetical protein H5410_053269 [Solanum commersonii]|uniref:NB-ARC domain-containing protein n=1 Tax=Solanum commersonii TaxID=4109 RepID=A0A9J5X3Y4_SOLCO|nr:hypothetical protein H5410_053269 [Solanum commersonii]
MVIMENRIVEICQGLPLAASVLGGLIRNNEKHEWQEVLDSNSLVALLKMILGTLKNSKTSDQLIQLGWRRHSRVHVKRPL